MPNSTDSSLKLNPNNAVTLHKSCSKFYCRIFFIGQIRFYGYLHLYKSHIHNTVHNMCTYLPAQTILNENAKAGYIYIYMLDI